MSIPVLRTCTRIPSKDEGQVFADDAKPLSAYRSTPAYVLLGDPGAGKTTEFIQESEAVGDTAVRVTARSFVADVHSREELEGRTLFIDGLDEMRAGAADARVPLDKIRRRLVRLGRPRFRISCREADWLGPNDRRSLEEVSPDSTIKVLLLDQLSHKAKRELLADEIGVHDVEAFEDEANRRGLGAMLGNPHELKLLADAVEHGGAWPDSRLESLDLACRKKATEHNSEHRAVARSHPPEAILDAAGHTCALLLLCGFEGTKLALPGAAADSVAGGFVPLDDLRDATADQSRELLKAALSTTLFKPDGETIRVPHHRQIAEFLAGRYLAKLISEGLPAPRVVALMTGRSDGRVVTVLRGLSAWLAAHSGEARQQLIDADPVGIGLYGDLGAFTLHDRERLLRSLVEFAAQGPLFGHEWHDSRANEYRYSTGWAFRTLASTDLTEAIKRLLDSPADEAEPGRTAEFILDVLANAETSEQESLAVLAPDLLAIVYDANRPPRVIAKALDAYIHLAPASRTTDETLAVVLDDVQRGSIPDQHDDLRRTLLERLYPHVIRPADVWRYALPGSRQRAISSLGGFWNHRVLRESPDHQISELLDALCEDAQHLVPALTHSYLDDLPLQLVARGLRAFGDTLEAERLYCWLDVTGRTHRERRRRDEDARFVRRWLETRPEVQKELFLIWLRERVSSEPDGLHRYLSCDPLLYARPPADFGLWCLDQATALEDSEPAVALELLGQAYWALADPAIRDGLTPAVMRERVGTGRLARRLAEFDDQRSTDAEIEADKETDEWRRDMEARREQLAKEERQRREGWRQGLSSHFDDLRHNRFFAQDLHTLAQVYLGMFVDGDEEASPRQRIHDFIGGEEVLVEAVMAAIRGAVFRDDVPTVDETVSLHSESKHSWLAYPVLASLHLLGEENPAHVNGISDDRKREALAILYCVPSDRGDTPERWFQGAPELVLDVLYACAVPEVRAGAECVPCLNALNSFTGHDDLLHHTRLRLLDSIRTRSPNKQMSLLDDLLAPAIRHSDPTPLRELAARKLSLKSTTVAQRVRWLAVDALLSGEPCLRTLKEYVCAEETEVRIRHFAEVLLHTSLHRDMSRSILADVRDQRVLRDAIEILGPAFRPVEWGGWITLEMRMPQLVGSLIQQLSAIAGDEVDRAFTELIDDPRMARWRDLLTWAHERQRVVHRDATYRHPSIEEVQRTLSRGAPANAADLAALLQDRMGDISADLRGDNSNLWRQFWSDDRSRWPTEAKHEDSCRDALLGALKRRLPLEVDAAPEGRYASDNRADIRASCAGFNVPVEIKKNSHPDLWSAMHRQLIGKYTTDPATSGYGVYLVLWCGADKTRTPPDGERPATPEALRQRLVQDLAPAETRKISVIVMDVTKPGEPAALDPSLRAGRVQPSTMAMSSSSGGISTPGT